jgi:hypothetical protein
MDVSGFVIENIVRMGVMLKNWLFKVGWYSHCNQPLEKLILAISKSYHKIPQFDVEITIMSEENNIYFVCVCVCGVGYLCIYCHKSIFSPFANQTQHLNTRS